MNTNSLLLLSLISYTLIVNAFITPRFDLDSALSNQGVNTNKIGCKCIMTATTDYFTDSTMCMCFNRSDGTINDTAKCQDYIGTWIETVSIRTRYSLYDKDSVFGFCSDITEGTNSWQTCLRHYCPCNGGKHTKPPINKVYF
jgi:hypothetical protein